MHGLRFRIHRKPRKVLQSVNVFIGMRSHSLPGRDNDPLDWTGAEPRLWPTSHQEIISWLLSMSQKNSLEGRESSGSNLVWSYCLPVIKELWQEKGTLNFKLPSFIPPGKSAGSLKRKEQNKFKTGVRGWLFVCCCCFKYDQLRLCKKGRAKWLNLVAQ